jgi:hypothetical protein
VAISALLYSGLALLAFGGVSLAYPPRFLGIATRDTALRSGFVLLAEEKDREIVLGTLVARPRGSRVALPADAAETSRRFAALSASGYAKAAMNFRVEPGENGFSLVTTETRVFSTDPKTARAFAVYWRFIYPGSALIRRMWLDAIAERAERTERAPV